MEILLLVARALLAIVFLVAGSAKLLDLRGSQQALRAFGFPHILANPLGILLPLAEISIACLLLPAISAWWASLGAFVLLVIFLVFMSIALARGEKPHCGCFGQLSTEPISSTTLVRNGVLAIIAGSIVFQDPPSAGPSMIHWIAGMTYMQLISSLITALLLGTVCVEGWFLVHLLKQHGRLLIRIEDLEKRLAPSKAEQDFVQPGTIGGFGLPIGRIAPSFQLRDIDDKATSLQELQHAEKPIMLIFIDPDCGPCSSLLPEIGDWQRDYADRVTIALISRGSVTANRLKASEHGIAHLLVQNDFEVAQTYRVQYTPSAVVVRPNGIIGSPLVTGADAIRELIDNIAAVPVSPMIVGSTSAWA